MKVLYHYTAEMHLDSILADGQLKLSESNLKDHRYDGWNPYDYEAGRIKLYKPVVWMTDVEEPEIQALGLVSAVDKSVIKVTIKKQPYFKKWKEWSRANNIDKEWARIIEKNRQPNTWWISELVVTMKEIVKIENRATGEVYYENPELIGKL